MGGIISSFLPADLFDRTLNFGHRQANYIWRLENNLDDLETELDKLIRTKEDLWNQVELATQQQPAQVGPTEQVGQMQTKVRELQQERDQEMDRLCLGGFCSKDLTLSYKFGRDVVTLKDHIISVKDERGNIQNVVQRLPEGAAVPKPLEPAIVGRQSILDRVWRCITDQEKNKGIIGFEQPQHHFDVVIWSVVSSKPNLKQIQDDIGERLGLIKERIQENVGEWAGFKKKQIQENTGGRTCFSKESKPWQEKCFEAKASDITSTLQHKKFVLLLDDIWEPIIDLTELGVPLRRLHFGSKIVFTTRSFGACSKMRADKKFEVSHLGDDDAWNSFQEVGGFYFDSHSEIRELDKTMASQCHGLPLALKTVGQAMAGKEYPEEWRRDIEIISTSASKFEDMEKKVLSRLKFSYDKLPKDERSCLLYCCLFPADSEIPKTDLIEYWKSEGFVDSNSGWGVLGALARACLLEDGGDHVKIHDMIRDMALWIANEIEKDKENFLVLTGVQKTDAPNFEKWGVYKRISLMESGIQSLPEVPNCPRLQTLLLEHNRIEEITDGFFQSLPSLRVLSLRGNDSLTKLPLGISSLVSLHHLDLSRTSLRELPEELKALENLRYLNLEETSEMSRIPKQLISSFSKLRVLRMRKCGGVRSGDEEPLMKDLLCLEHLNVISLTLDGSKANVIPILFKYQKLVSITQSLDIIFCLDPGLNALSLANLASMEELEELNISLCIFEEFKSTGEVKKLLQSGFRSLRKVRIDMCDANDLTWLVFVPNLQQLEITFCSDMEEIISGKKFSEGSETMGEPNLFAQLESLIIFGLTNLKSICWTPLTLPKLKEIQVFQCRQLKKLPLKSSNVKDRQIVIVGQKEWWEELEWGDEATKNSFSPCFVPAYGGRF